MRHELDLAGKHVGVTVVHPGGVRTGIAKNARIAAAVPKEQIERMEGIWEKLLRDSPESVAETIVSGTALRREARCMWIGCPRVDVIQRLMPVNYWNLFRKKMLKGK